MSNQNMIELEGETLMNVCRQVLNGDKTFEEVRESVEMIVGRMEGLIEDKKDRLKKLLANM